MATPKKTIAVVGATGNQGGSVVKTFLATPGWHVRALTRNTESSAAKALAEQGAELVAADLDDEATLVPAFRGAHAIFSATDFFALTRYPNAAELVANKYGGVNMNRACFEHELQQGKNVVSAASKVLRAAEGEENSNDDSKNNRLEVFVLSTLSHASRWSKGQIRNLLHFDCKAEVVEHLRAEHPRLAAITNYLQVGVYMSNILFLRPQRSAPDDDNGEETFAFRWAPINPDTVLPAVDPARDTGVFVRALLSAPFGTVLLGQSDPVTVQQLVDLWSEVTGRRAKLDCLPFDEAVRWIDGVMPGGGWGLEMAENMPYYRDFGYTGGDPAVKRPADLGIDQNGLAKYRDYLKEQDWDSLLK